jgi:hypothetical protein
MRIMYRNLITDHIIYHTTIWRDREALTQCFGSDLQHRISSVVCTILDITRFKFPPVSKYIEIFIEISWGGFREER